MRNLLGLHPRFSEVPDYTLSGIMSPVEVHRVRGAVALDIAEKELNAEMAKWLTTDAGKTWLATEKGQKWAANNQ